MQPVIGRMEEKVVVFSPALFLPKGTSSVMLFVIGKLL